MSAVLNLMCRPLSRWTLGLAILLLAVPWVAAQKDVDPFSDANKKVDPTAPLIKFDWSISPQEPKAGEIVTVTFRATLAKGAHAYPLTRRTSQQTDAYLTKPTYLDTTVFRPLYPITESDPQEHTDKIGDKEETLLQHEHDFTWTQDFLVQDTATPGKKFISIAPELQACDDSGCKTGLRLLDVPVRIDEGKPTTLVRSDIDQRFAKPPATVVEVGPPSGFGPPLVPDPVRNPKDSSKENNPKSTEPSGNRKDEPKPSVAPGYKDAAADADLLTFIGMAVFWGALSLVTPCVFPMIPITVSFFIKQSEAKNHSPLLLALVYSGTIAGVLTISGIFLIQLLQPFSQHFATNYFLGLLLIAFALSLFGMYEIVLPSRLVNLVSAQERRGGLLGTVFMALSFSIISFTCVAPFYGGFIGISSSAQGGAWWSNPNLMLKLGLGALAYSVTFASPFFVLALFPTLMRALPKSGSWMNTVKVVMGFLELAAAFKFLRAGELTLMGRADFLTYDLVLGVYVALAFACGLYLLNLYRLPHDHGAPEPVGVLRLLFAIAFLAIGLYIMPGLFRQGNGQHQRSSGVVFSWLETFLLPDEEPAVGGTGTSSEKQEIWLSNLDEALDKAERENKLVFIDFTGMICQNCKLNEGNVFPLPKIRALFGEYVLLKLFCDQIPANVQSKTTAQQNERFRDETFHDAKLPLYAIVKPTGGGKFEIVGVYDEGKINFPDRFADFLRKPLGK